MTQSVKTDYVLRFREEIARIDKLKSTPQLIIEHSVGVIDTALKQKDLNNTSRQVLRNGQAALKNISESSIAKNYQIIYSQMCILAVSSLEATLKLYFENAANNHMNLKKENKRLREMKVTIEDIIANNLRFGGKMGKLILEKDKPNFQDLKTIKDVFRDYFGKEVQLGEIDQKFVIFYLELRHVLVHKSGEIDEKFVQATTKMKANVKNYKIGDKPVLNADDWENITSSFEALIESVTRPKSGRIQVVKPKQK